MLLFIKIIILIRTTVFSFTTNLNDYFSLSGMHTYLSIPCEVSLVEVKTHQFMRLFFQVNDAVLHIITEFMNSVHEIFQPSN